MQSKHPLRIVNYAVNGLGLGHLTRLTAISRQLRRIATTAGIATEISFLTSSESDSLCYAHGFASFKIPSKNAVAQSRFTPQRYRKIAKQWIWNAVNVMSPDILVVDTFPAGSFHELYDILDFGQRNVFIYRAVKEEVASLAGFQSALRGYHSIIQTVEQGCTASPVPEDCEERVEHIGEILIRSRDEILSRADARQQLGLRADDKVVYCTIGGGGDTRAQELIDAFRRLAALKPEYTFVIGAGPLYRGAEVHAPNIRWTQRLLMVEYFNAFDCALTAGGFNSVNELLHCGIPCLFMPQERKYDDQFQRTQLHVERGAGLMAERSDAAELLSKVEELLLHHDSFSRHALRAVPRNYAHDAAVEILKTTIAKERLEEACDLLYHAELSKRALSLADEHNYCEILACLSLLAKQHPENNLFSDTAQRSEFASEIVHYAQQNNRSMRDAVRALRMFKKRESCDNDKEAIQLDIQELILESPQPSTLNQDPV